MNSSQCDNLDAFLCGWLPEDEAARFESHLAGCSACRREIDQQQKLDRLLGPAAEHLGPAPSSLIDRIDRQLRSIRRRRLVRLACGLTTASVLAVAVGVWLGSHPAGGPSARQPVVQRHVEPETGQGEVEPAAQLASDVLLPARVSLADPSEAILVPLETSNPNVSIVWVYPTVMPAHAPSDPAAGKSP